MSKTPTGKWWEKSKQEILNIKEALYTPVRGFLNVSINNEKEKKRAMLIEALFKTGGIYLDWEIYALKSIKFLMKFDTTIGLDKDGIPHASMIISKPGSKFMEKWIKSHNSPIGTNWLKTSDKTLKEIVYAFPNLVHLETNTIHNPSHTELNRLYGNIIYDWKNNIAINAWTQYHGITYDDKSVNMAGSTLAAVYWSILNKEYFVVPKIIHFTRYSATRLTFRFHHFLSILSANTHIKPVKIMFWYEFHPQGYWWTRMLQRVPHIIMNYRKAPESIFGNKIMVAEHQSDVVRLEVLMKYGGIYLDLDVIVLKSFDPILRSATTMGLERTGWLDNGIILSKADSPFLKILYNSYRSFNDYQWAEHSVRVLARLVQEHPDLIHIELKSLNRPNWMELLWLYGNNKIYNWRENYAIHFWYRYHNIEHTPNGIRHMNTTMGEIFWYIYFGSPSMF